MAFCMFTHMREVGVDVSNEQPLRLRFHFDTHAKPRSNAMRLDIMDRLQKHSLAIVYRNQWLNWSP